MIDQWFAKQGWAIAEELHRWIADRWLNIFFSLEMILDVIIWQNFQSEILASNRHTSFILIQMIVLTMFGAKTWGWISKWNFNYFTWNEIDIIIWQNFHSEILTSNHQTIWWNFQCEILAWNIVYLYSNDCLNHIWWKNLTMNFKINFFSNYFAWNESWCFNLTQFS